jgi:hypothetical protein
MKQTYGDGVEEDESNCSSGGPAPTSKKVEAGRRRKGGLGTFAALASIVSNGGRQRECLPVPNAVLGSSRR